MGLSQGSISDAATDSDSSAQSDEPAKSEEDLYLAQVSKALQEAAQAIDGVVDDPEIVYQHRLEKLKSTLEPLDYIWHKMATCYETELPRDRHDAYKQIAAHLNAVLLQTLELTLVSQASARSRMLASELILSLHNEVQNMNVRDEAAIPRNLKERQQAVAHQLTNGFACKLNARQVTNLQSQYVILLKAVVVEISELKKLTATLPSDKLRSEGQMRLFFGWLGYLAALCNAIGNLAYGAGKLYCGCCERTKMRDTERKLTSSVLALEGAPASRDQCVHLQQKYDVLQENLEQAEDALQVVRMYIEFMQTDSDVLKEYQNLWAMLKEKRVREIVEQYKDKLDKLTGTARDLEEIVFRALANWTHSSQVHNTGPHTKLQSSRVLSL